MSYAVYYNQAERIIEVKVQGNVAKEDVREIYDQWLQIAKEQECFSVLYDWREATLSHLSTMDIYELPRILAKMVIPLGIRPGRLRRAVVTSENDDEDKARFAETVTANVGQVAKFFHDMDAARQWLGQN
jgi:hypothetical protein